jgi:phosphoribosyl-dephospho-CoA transferase
MGIAPHDILKIQPVGLCDVENRPAWVNETLKSTPFVVVRRAALMHNQIPVGVRGQVRQQRYAGLVSIEHILICIKPEMLAQAKSWQQNRHFSKELISTLEKADQVLSAQQLVWGPTGSVGFELATGLPVVSSASDLDCLLRADTYLSQRIAEKIYAELKAAGTKFDVQLETPQGAVSLVEYSRGARPFLLRTLYGPKLVNTPWQMLWEEKTT